MFLPNKNKILIWSLFISFVTVLNGLLTQSVLAQSNSFDSCLDSPDKFNNLPIDKANIRLKKCELKFKLENSEIEYFWQNKSLEEAAYSLVEQESFWQIITLIGGIIAYFFGKKEENKVRNEQYLREFKLKSAEIILNSKNPHAADAKARALDNLFPNDVRENFADEFNPYQYEAAVGEVMQTEIFKVLIGKMGARSAHTKLRTILSDLERIKQQEANSNSKAMKAKKLYLRAKEYARASKRCFWKWNYKKNLDLAIENLEEAIELDSECEIEEKRFDYKNQAKSEPDFEYIKEETDFQCIVNTEIQR